MATYDQLPVYKTSYDLLVELFLCVKEFKRDYRHTLGESIKNETIEMMMCIYRANSTYSKEPFLRKAREHAEVILLLLRVCKDLRQIGLEKFIDLNEKLESVSRQLTAWHKSVKIAPDAK